MIAALYVEQGHYGHTARKATWLYACHVELPSLRWGEGEQRLDPMMFVRRRDDGSWWTSVRVGAVDWHSYSHRSARAAMLAGSTIAALMQRVAA